MGAIAEALPPEELGVTAEDGVGEDVVEPGGAVVVGLEDALVHPARPKAPTASMTIDQLRTRDMGILSDGGRPPCGSARHARR
jgi:hypothetical protein